MVYSIVEIFGYVFSRKENISFTVTKTSKSNVEEANVVEETKLIETKEVKEKKKKSKKKD